MFETENPAMSVKSDDAGAARDRELAGTPISSGPTAQATAAGALHSMSVRMRASPQVRWSQTIPMMLPPNNPQFLAYYDVLLRQLVLFSLKERSPAPRPVYELPKHAQTGLSQAMSNDSVCLGFADGRLEMFDIGMLVAAAEAVDPQMTQPVTTLCPRAQGKCTTRASCTGLTFGANGGRLFAMAIDGSEISVHNAHHQDLPVVQTLPFTVGHGLYSSSRLAATNNLLVAAGGGSGSLGPDAQLAHVWQVQDGVHASDATLMKLCWTHRFGPEAESVAICASQGLLAVGLRDGTIQVFSSASALWVIHTKIARIANETDEDQPVWSLQFSRDGTKLAAGRPAFVNRTTGVGVARVDHFSVYDMLASAALVNEFHSSRESSGSNALAFLHDSGTDMLATGSGIPGNYNLRTLHPRGITRMLTMTSAGGSPVQPISSGDLDPVSGVVALCAGSVLQVFDQRGNLLLDKDFGQGLKTYGIIKSAVKLQVGGSIIACALNSVEMIVLEVGGSEAFRISQNPALGDAAYRFGTVYEMAWSPDGKLLAMGTSSDGALVLSASGNAIHKHGKHASSCAFDGTSSKFVSADGLEFEVSVWDVQTWKLLHTVPNISRWIGSVALSPVGDRVAYMEGVCDADVVVWPLDPSSGKEPQRSLGSVNARSALSFSPDGRFILCCPADTEPTDPHKLQVLDLATSANALWGQALRVMSLPVTGGMLAGRTLGWAQIPLQSAPESDSESTSVTKLLALYGAVGPQFVVTDVETARDAADDAAWSTQQLIFISENHPELVKTIATTTPYCVNVRDPETRDTVFHYLARNRQTQVLRTWFDNGAKVTPIENAKGQTALMVALEMEQSDIARLLWSNMTNTLSFISASLILEELRILSRNHPNMVGQYLADIEPVITQTVAMFRTELTRHAEVCGLPTPTLTTSDASEDSATVSGMQSAVPHVWADRLPNDRPKMLVASKVVIVPYLLGDAKSSPFHDIVTNCDASVFDSSLLELIVQYKWEASVRSQRQWAFLTYGATFAIGSAAMLSSTARLQELEPTSTVDVLQGSMIALNW